MAWTSDLAFKSRGKMDSHKIVGRSRGLVNVEFLDRKAKLDGG